MFRLDMTLAYTLPTRSDRHYENSKEEEWAKLFMNPEELLERYLQANVPETKANPGIWWLAFYCIGHYIGQEGSLLWQTIKN